MSSEDFGLKLTALEALAYIVPGTVFVWVMVEIEAARIGYLPRDWPVTSLDTAMALALVVLAGITLQQAGHLLKLPYDKVYKPWRRRNGDPVRDTFNAQVAKDGVQFSQPYTYAVSALRNAGRPMDRILMLEGISKMFRAVTLGLAVLAVVALLAWEPWVAVAAILGAVGAFWVHAHFRYEGTCEVYQAYVQWRNEAAAPSA